MKTTVTKWATKAAGAGAIALLLATPSFAQSRGDWNRNNDTSNDRNGQASARDNGNRSNDNDSYRENQRINETGKVTSFSRERDGYRVQLDRSSHSFWVPQSTFGSRARDLRVGVSITLGGVFRGGSIYADAVTWPEAYGQYGHGNGFVRGIVDRVDYRTGTVWLRDDATGRVITADVDGRSAIRSLRRGEYVELTGQWIRGGVFDVARIDNVRSHRY